MLQAALVLARLRSHLGRSLVLVVVVAVACWCRSSACRPTGSRWWWTGHR